MYHYLFQNLDRHEAVFSKNDKKLDKYFLIKNNNIDDDNISSIITTIYRWKFKTIKASYEQAKNIIGHWLTFGFTNPKISFFQFVLNNNFFLDQSKHFLDYSNIKLTRLINVRLKIKKELNFLRLKIKKKLEDKTVKIKEKKKRKKLIFFKFRGFEREPNKHKIKFRKVMKEKELEQIFKVDSYDISKTVLKKRIDDNKTRKKFFVKQRQSRNLFLINVRKQCCFDESVKSYSTFSNEVSFNITKKFLLKNFFFNNNFSSQHVLFYSNNGKGKKFFKNVTSLSSQNYTFFGTYNNLFLIHLYNKIVNKRAFTFFLKKNYLLNFKKRFFFDKVPLNDSISYSSETAEFWLMSIFRSLKQTKKRILFLSIFSVKNFLKSKLNLVYFNKDAENNFIFAHKYRKIFNFFHPVILKNYKNRFKIFNEKLRLNLRKKTKVISIVKKNMNLIYKLGCNYKYKFLISDNYRTFNRQNFFSIVNWTKKKFRKKFHIIYYKNCKKKFNLRRIEVLYWSKKSKVFSKRKLLKKKLLRKKYKKLFILFPIKKNLNLRLKFIFFEHQLKFFFLSAKQRYRQRFKLFQILRRKNKIFSKFKKKKLKKKNLISKFKKKK